MRPPRLERGKPLVDKTVIKVPEPAKREEVFGDRQHLIYDITSRKPDAGYQVNDLGHLSSNTKIAALAFIARLRGLEYIKANQASIKKMMSMSHNDATIVEVAKAMEYDKASMFQAAFKPLSADARGRINRGNEDLIANKYPKETRAFFDAYRTALGAEKMALGIVGAKIGDTSGRAERGLRHGTSEASPLHVAHLVEYLYNLDKGKTLKAIGNPNDKPHTTWSYLRGRDKPGDGQVFFAKTGTLSADLYHELPKGSNVKQKYPDGVFVLTLGYIQEGKPKVAFFRAGSDDERKELANTFLDKVAGVEPQLIARQQRAPRLINTA